jgi:hypothetical protein
MIFPRATRLLAMSMTTGSPLLVGMATERGLVPTRAFFPPQGAIVGFALLKANPTRFLPMPIME